MFLVETLAQSLINETPGKCLSSPGPVLCPDELEHASIEREPRRGCFDRNKVSCTGLPGLMERVSTGLIYGLLKVAGAACSSSDP